MPVQTSQKQLMPKECIVEGEQTYKLELDENDEKIISATLKAFESGTLTPLIKEELRCTIQSRRMAEGKGEMKVEFRKPLKKKMMSDDEMKRAQKRRQQNREAAQRFRQKQKDVMDYLGAKIRRLEKSSQMLTEDLKRLRHEKVSLTQMLNDHLVVCSNVPQNTLRPTIDVDQMVGQTSTSTFSVVSEPESATSCLDTATSDGSVFFFDYDYSSLPNPNAAVVTIENETRQNILDEEEIPKDVCYEEIVVEMNQADLDYGDDQRPDSCSSLDTMSRYGSCSSDITSLSESAADLGNSIASAHHLVHMESCTSEPFDPSGMNEDLFLLDALTP